jgi:hypothetical protein
VKWSGCTLKKKLINAIPECNAQIELFKAFTNKQPEHVDGWLTMVRDWEAKKTEVNPYKQPKSSTSLSILIYIISHLMYVEYPSEVDICLTLFAAKKEEVEQGVLSIHEVSLCSFMTAGLELEEQQSVVS